jgi:hypothetical protein
VCPAKSKNFFDLNMRFALSILFSDTVGYKVSKINPGSNINNSGDANHIQSLSCTKKDEKQAIGLRQARAKEQRRGKAIYALRRVRQRRIYCLPIGNPIGTIDPSQTGWAMSRAG